MIQQSSHEHTGLQQIASDQIYRWPKWTQTIQGYSLQQAESKTKSG